MHVCMRACVQESMRALGADIVDLMTVSQSYFDGAYDGVHYLSSGAMGRVSHMMFQVIMNTLYPTCGPQLSEDRDSNEKHAYTGTDTAAVPTPSASTVQTQSNQSVSIPYSGPMSLPPAVKR